MTLLIVGITLIPPTLGRLYGPQDRVHVGTYWYNQDFTQYQATMREAATSPSWLVHDHSSAEPHEPVFMFPLYSAIGKLATATSLDALAVYAAVEMAGRVVLSIALYVFAASMIGSVAGRRLAFVLTAFSSGLSFWAFVGQAFLGTVPSSPEIRPGGTTYVVEVVTFGNFFTAPHLALGLAATLVAVVLFAAASRGSRRALALLAANIATLGLLNPFNLPVLLCVFGIHAVWRSLGERHAVRWAFAACAAATGAAVPMLVYNFTIFSLAPFWGLAYGADNRLPSPAPWSLPVEFGIALLLAPFGALALRRARTSEQALLITWLLVGLVCMYAPVAYQRRFAFGLQPALATLAAIGWPLALSGIHALSYRFGVRRCFGRAAVRRLATSVIALLAFPTTGIAFLVIALSAATNEPMNLYMVDRDTYEIGQWIAERSGPNDVVAGSLSTGNALSGIVPGRVVARWERNHATLNGESKSAAISAMYQGELSPGEMNAFLDENRATYLIVGPEERKLGAHDPGADLGLPVATRIGEATAYWIKR